MIIIIDGYNVLKQVVTKKDISESQRLHFIETLSHYARRKHHAVTVIFDGGPYDWPLRDRVREVSVVYSGCNETADDYIMHLLEEKRALDLLLVSSDRVLTQYAEQRDIPFIDSDYFWNLVHQEVHKKSDTFSKKESILTKLTSDDNPELDMLMQEGAAMTPPKVDDMMKSRSARVSHKASKRERKRQALLKKL